MKNIKSIILSAGLALGLCFGFTHKAEAANYKVVYGDSLYNIGTIFNTTSNVIMKNNNLSSDNIYPGQVLNITADNYTVISGDSLYLIAKKYGILLYNLRKANNMWTDNLYIGQVLTVPTVSYNSSNGSSSNGSASATAKISYTASDVDLLARLITAEAQGEPYNALVAVGATIVNRVKSTTFANTISSVIYEKIDGYYQFTPVKNGWINKPATSDAVQAAYAALSGQDPTKGGLYYFDDSSTNAWLWSRPISIIIDKLVFTH